MKKNFCISVLLLLFCSTISAQMQEKHIEQLTGLARVWGTVKYFHPYLAYKELDWDKALVEAIPNVNQSKNATEYAEAINLMLSTLGDNQTKAFVKKDQTKVIPPEAKSLYLDNGVLYWNVLAAARLSSVSNEKSDLFTQDFFTLLIQAKSLVIDSRYADESNPAILFEIDWQIKKIIPELLDKKITIGTERYRMHNGYTAQDGTSSGGYYSGSMTDMPTAIGDNEVKPFKTPPIVVIADENSMLNKIWSGLQWAGKAMIVSEIEDLGLDFYNMKLADDVVVKIRTTEIIAPDGSVGFAPDVFAAKGEGTAAAQQIIKENKFVSIRPKKSAAGTVQISQKDKTYPEMEFPNKEYRLLALFRFWNVINYFYPYKNLTDINWNDILPKYIPQFEADTSALSYRLTAGKMVAEIDDSHGFFKPPKLKNSPVFFFPPTLESYAENQTYIRAVIDSTSGIRAGDVVLEVDGIPIKKYIEDKFSIRVAASTPQALMRSVHTYGIFRGEKDSKTLLKLRGLDGKIRKVNVVRNIAADDSRLYNLNNFKRQTPVISILPSGFAYVDLDRLQNNQVDSMFNIIKNAPATIFDMRGYPNGTAWPIAPRLSNKDQPIAALFDNPILEGKNLNNEDYTLTPNFTFSQQLPKREGEIYRGKIVMLIDENAQSQAEHTCLFFEAAKPDIVFIGTPTAGANGDVTNLFLPGNIKVSFSGHGVRHADGRQLQRLGIQPTINVAPTIQGILSGRDEILEAAIRYLKNTKFNLQKQVKKQ